MFPIYCNNEFVTVKEQRAAAVKFGKSLAERLPAACEVVVWEGEAGGIRVETFHGGKPAPACGEVGADIQFCSVCTDEKSAALAAKGS